MKAAQTPITVLVIGDKGVGKTTIVNHIGSHGSQLPMGHMWHMGARVHLWQQGTQVALHALDVPHQNGHGRTPATLYRQAHGALAVYDVTNRASYDGPNGVKAHIKDFMRQAVAGRAEPLPVVLVANKVDGVSGAERKFHGKVARDEAQAYAKQLGVAFYEISAKSGNLGDAVSALAAVAMKSGLKAVVSAAGSGSSKTDADIELSTARVHPHHHPGLCAC